MKLLFTLILGISVLTVNAQTFNFPNGSELIYEHQVDTFVDLTISFEFNTINSYDLDWYVVENTFPEEWISYVCDFWLCHAIPDEFEVKNTFTIPEDTIIAGAYPFMKLRTKPNGFSGEGLLKLYVYDELNENQGDTLTFLLSTIQNVNVNSLEFSNAVNIYPNPSVNHCIIENNFSERLEIEIFDCIGKKISNEVVNAQEKIQLDLSHLDKGIYFVQYSNSLGEKFVKKLKVS